MTVISIFNNKGGEGKSTGWRNGWGRLNTRIETNADFKRENHVLAENPK